MFCPDCGSEVAEGRKFCGKCGGQLHAASGSVDTEQSIPESPEGAVAQVPKPPLSTRTKLTYALVALLVVLGGVAWWWFHRPAPAFRAEDPGIYPFQDQGKWGFIDAQGNILIQPRLEQVVPSLIQGQWVFFNEGLCEIKANGKWGYIDKGGSFAIPAQFDQARLSAASPRSRSETSGDSSIRAATTSSIRNLKAQATFTMGWLPPRKTGNGDSSISPACS